MRCRSTPGTGKRHLGPGHGPFDAAVPGRIPAEGTHRECQSGLLITLVQDPETVVGEQGGSGGADQLHGIHMLGSLSDESSRAGDIPSRTR
jgi:hypothetical protein